MLVPPAASALERLLEAHAGRLPRAGKVEFSAVERACGVATAEVLADVRGRR